MGVRSDERIPAPGTGGVGLAWNGPEMRPIGCPASGGAQGAGSGEDAQMRAESGPETSPVPRLSKTLHDRHREPGELPSKVAAIHRQCRHCRGWEGDGRGLAAEVDACPNATCSLWAFRSKAAASTRCATGSTGPNRTGAIRRFCRDCQSVPEGASLNPVRECASVGCWLYPWRNGALDKAA